MTSLADCLAVSQISVGILFTSSKDSARVDWALVQKELQFGQG